ncbi:MAG: pyridine nucleotide-disulfide oxidoreductase [Chloroflexi bacterium]|nr:MAG: pyridine nucleotide-disulfide oxidoreductase [Chloroflexota bacterium]
MRYKYDVVIIGVGSAGMIAGEVAAKMGVKAAIVERHRIGGDCLWTGCVPSKALLASAKAAHTIRHADKYGLAPTEIQPDTASVWRRIGAIQQDIANTDDNPDKYAELGVDLLWGDAGFEGEHRIRVGDRVLTAQFALVCTGSRPAAPKLEGLADIGYLTSENVFELERAPRSLIIIGGGPIGVELAQAMSRLGVKTTVLQRAGRILERDEPVLAAILVEKLRNEGVDVQLSAELASAGREGAEKVVRGRVGGEEKEWRAAEVLVAAGRMPNIETLGLESVGIKTGPRGIVVDDKLRTGAAWVYAAGDCAGRYLFTHSAAAEAVTALRNMFFPGSGSAPEMVPWTTFTDPELAHVGMTAGEARKKLGKEKVRVFEWELGHSDRARAEEATEGRMIVITDSKFKIVGAHILAPSAGEMIAQFTLAVNTEMRLTPDFGNLVQVYPTFSTSVAQLAAEATYGQLQKPFLQTLRRINGLFSRS